MNDQRRRLTLCEKDAAILETIANGYEENSAEHLAITHAAIALWYALMDDPIRFRRFVRKFQGDLTPAQRAHLISMGIDPDAEVE